MSSRFPRLDELGVRVHCHASGSGLNYVNREELNAALGENLEEFRGLFGIQTCLVEGLFAHDVEAVLELMQTGVRTGTQSEELWD